MMTRRRFALLLTTLPFVGKLFAQKETVVDPRQWSYPTTVSPIQAATGHMLGEWKDLGATGDGGRFYVKEGPKFPWNVRSADGCLRSRFPTEEAARAYLDSMFAMDWHGLGRVTCWAKILNGLDFHEVGPPFTSMVAAQEWMRGLTISKGE